MEIAVFWFIMFLGFIWFLLSRKTKCMVCKSGYLKLTHVEDPLPAKESLSPLKGMFLPESKETKLKFHYSCDRCNKKWVKIGSKLIESQ
tara:strand:+ start:109 stop:375 length:267 start_codon:yes stop_codon:yes gene_type:complete